MAAHYDSIAKEYQRCKQAPWRLHIEYFTLFQMLGDLQGKSALDLACGEGHYSRLLKQHGAARVLGVDLSPAMIDLARAEESKQALGIEYAVADATQFQPAEPFDIVFAAYLLNYAQTRDQLLAMCRGIAQGLKPGGRLVAVNSNQEQPIESYPVHRKYGFDRRAVALREGEPITWTIHLEDRSFEFDNYYLSSAAYEWALDAAGLRQIRWQLPQLSPQGEKENGKEYWKDFLETPPVMFLECVWS